MTKWQKKGRIFAPNGDHWWARSHTHLPTVEVIDDRLIRVYFAGLDEDKFGRIGFVDLAIDDPTRILAIPTEPILDLGNLGAFDDSGSVPSCMVTIEGTRHLYYIGFQRAERVPYMLFTGLAIEESPGSFVRYSQTPILDRTPSEPFSRSAPFVMQDDGVLKMWYWSCRHWINDQHGVHYSNVIRYATSADGISWEVHPHVCVSPNEPDEYSIGRPCVVRDRDRYRLWYSARSFSKLYTIGYAESADGIYWERRDSEAGISISDNGWDSEMVCYPYVVEIRGQLHMFYNGNGHGASGFGYAVLEA